MRCGRSSLRTRSSSQAGDRLSRCNACLMSQPSHRGVQAFECNRGCSLDMDCVRMPGVCQSTTYALRSLKTGTHRLVGCFDDTRNPGIHEVILSRPKLRGENHEKIGMNMLLCPQGRRQPWRSTPSSAWCDGARRTGQQQGAPPPRSCRPASTWASAPASGRFS